MRELSGQLKAGKGDGGRGKGPHAPERLFEGAGPLIERLRAESPFISGAVMLARARQILAELSESDQIAVINAHPRIGERAERLRAQSAAAYLEQGSDRDDRLAPLNDEYEQKFGFRFVVFVNRRPQAAIVPVLEARLQRSRDVERATAIEEIVAIAEDRLKSEAS